MTRAVGIDLSLTGTGLAEVATRSPGVITYANRTVTSKPAGNDVRNRAARINRIRTTVLDFALGADLVLLEGPAFGKSNAGTWDRAWLWGMVVDGLLGADLPLAIAPPAVVKKFATGKRNADKVAVAVGMARLWGEECQCANDNEWDALTMATMGAQHLGIDNVPARAHHTTALESVAWQTEAVAQ
jgi:crossover junction endodeoxyribonuclease RuvC